MPRQFVNQSFTFVQPDGTTVAARGSGNQHHAVFEDEKGYTIVLDPVSGYYQYARPNADGTSLEPSGIAVGSADPAAAGLTRGVRVAPAVARDLAMRSFAPGARKSRWEERIVQKRNETRAARMAGPGGALFAPPQRQTVGNYVGICVLIEFPDVPATIARDEVDRFCNQPGYSGFGNQGSVRDYFFDVSNERLTYTNIVPAYVKASKPRAYYTNEQIADGVRARELILEALTALQARGTDFSPLTADSQGYIRALNLFYAGPVVNNWSKGLWPHSWHLATERSVGGGKHFFDYQFTAMGSELSLGTFCHENGHMICDFPDLYDYGYESNGVGDFCLMCAGGPEKNPTRVGAYLRRAAGWVVTQTPSAPNLARTLDLDAGDEVIVHRKSTTEYFLVENRFKSGRDAGLPGSGLAVWHIDELGENNHEMGTLQNHYECELEQADGKRDLENRVNQGDAGDLFSAPQRTAFGDTTTPSSRWWDGAPSGLEIHEIGASGRQIALRIGSSEGGGTGGGELAEGGSSPNRAIPDASTAGITDTIAIDRNGSIAAIELEVDIEHTYRGDLMVTLLAPSGVGVVVHNRSGASANDLKQTFTAETSVAMQALLGEEMHGTWTLRVQDLARVDTGTLKRWSLKIRGNATAGPVRLEESPETRIPSNQQTGITRTLSTQAGGVVADLSVEIDLTHTYIGDLVVTLTSPSGVSVKLHDREGSSRDNIVQTFSVANRPALAQMAGTPLSGAWKLRVQDLAAQDEGKLNRWALVLVPRSS